MFLYIDLNFLNKFYSTPSHNIILLLFHIIKYMKRSFLDCRLLHIDYDKHLCGEEKRKIQTEAKNKILAEFISSFGLNNAIIKGNTIISDKDKWFFTTTHAKGATMVYFSKWPAGIDCIATIDIPNNYFELIEKHFTYEEVKWLQTNNSKDNFAKLWTAKEALFKCYFNIYQTEINFSEWKVEIKEREIIYSKNNEIFVAQQGTSDKEYIFYICERDE